jgi:hypothetical protein
MHVMVEEINSRNAIIQRNLFSYSQSRNSNFIVGTYDSIIYIFNEILLPNHKCFQQK